MTQRPFSERYFSGYAGTRLGLREFARQHLKLTPKVPALLKRIGNHPMPPRLLDVGCGIGGLLEQLERHRPDLESFGIDLGCPPEFRAQACFLRGSINTLPFADNSFDIVTCAHVLEHLNNPGEAVSELFRVCRPGGIVYLETPSPRSALLPFGFNFWDDPTHVRPHSQTSLKTLIELSAGHFLQSGTKKSLAAILLGLPYMVLGGLMKDPQARVLFPLYAFGCVVWAIGEKK